MIQTIAQHAPIREYPHERTWHIDDRIFKVVIRPPGAKLRAPHTLQILQTHQLTSDEVGTFGLEPGNTWVEFERPFIEGTSLRDQKTCSETDIAKLAMAIRDLHEVGYPHGDLQPDNVILDGARLQLIDLPLFETKPGEAGHVIGSAPYMAPEIWSGEPPSLASDIYAFSALAAEMLSGSRALNADGIVDWANVHRDKTPTVHGLRAEISGLVLRGLAKNPDERPPIQQFIDALDATAVPPVVCRDFLERQAKAMSVAERADSTRVVCGERNGASVFLRWVALHSESNGRTAIVFTPTSIVRPIQRDVDPQKPWDHLTQLFESLGVESFSLTRGDQLHVFEQLTDTFLTCFSSPVTLLIDRVDQFSPDLVAWFSHISRVAKTRGKDFRCVTTNVQRESDADVELSAPEPRAWNRWRQETLRTEVRDIAQGRWDQLVKQNGHAIGQMLAALDEELGIATTIKAPPRIDTASLSALASTWRTEVEALFEQCAFVRATQLCEQLTQAFLRKQKYDDALAVAQFWTNAVTASGEADFDALVKGLEALSDAFPWRSAELIANVLHATGRHGEALERLQRPETIASAPKPELHAWLAQLSLSSGDFDGARQFADEVLDQPIEDPAVVVRLKLAKYGTGAILGDTAAIAHLKELVPELEPAGSDPITRARTHAYRAIGLSRIGDLDAATDAHLRALEEIENAGLDAELPTYLLNAGTAYNKQGRLGLAREYYARGIRLAGSATRPSTRGLLLANQANIDLSLGRHDEAQKLIARAEALATQHQLRSILAMCRSVSGDLRLAKGDPNGALEVYQNALDDPELSLSPYERAELRLARTEACLQLNDSKQAQENLNAARALMEQHTLNDLEYAYGMLRARQQWSESGSLGTMAGIELFRRHLLSAQEAGDHKLVLRQAPRLLTELEKEGLTELVVEVADVLRGSRNAISMGLTKELRRDFFANLPDADIAPAITAESRETKPRPHTSSQPENVEPFYRMLSLNEVILSAPKLRDLFEHALDIALSLSGAERGFVLLKDSTKSRVGEFKIESSRDVGGDPIPSPHLKVSLTIAQEAAQTGRTVVTINARDDQRFNEALSVVDLDLTSVLCVPIRDGSGLLGALYLDHRFKPGVFEGEVPRMMEAFGHQLALAVTNARQIEALRKERESLIDAQEQLANLLREREMMVEGLQDRCAQLTEQVEHERAKGSSLRDVFPNIAFASRVMEKVLDQVSRVARGDIPVVVNGESGVGKELIARAIHDASPRRNGPFVAFNCGAVPENLIESELFGHVKGAFTGADHDRVGLFVAASGGTIFLDEVGEMPTSMQVKLLRVLQERQVRPVGSTASSSTDVRVVAATNRDLPTMVNEGTFREDLFYRLAAFTIEIPALRDRREDIPLIGQTLIQRIADEMGRSAARLTADGARVLSQGDWPGNVRELENTLRAAVVLSDTDEIGEMELAPLVNIRSATPGKTRNITVAETRGRRPKATREDVVDAMRRANDDRERAASILGVSERTLYRYLKKYDLY